MSTTAREAAEAFSHHQFDRSYDALADDVQWRNVGGDHYDGKAAVVAACDQATQYFAGVDTTFTASRTFAGPDAVVVETAADYVEGDERSAVASCDIYEIVDSTIVAITSYNVAL